MYSTIVLVASHQNKQGPPRILPWPPVHNQGRWQSALGNEQLEILRCLKNDSYPPSTGGEKILRQKYNVVG